MNRYISRLRQRINPALPVQPQDARPVDLMELGLDAASTRPDVLHVGRMTYQDTPEVIAQLRAKLA